MKIKFKNLTDLFILMICGIVGVGFISGAEIYEFFVKFGDFCYVGIGLFFVLNFMLVFKILAEKANENNDTKMQKNIKNSSKNTFKYKKLIKSIFIFINVLLMSAAMFSGLKILAINLLNNNYLLVLIPCVIFVFIVLLFGINGLAKVDYFVFIFVFILSVVFAWNANTENVTNMLAVNNWAFGGIFGGFASSILFSFLYVFMNIVQVEPLYRESGVSLSKKQSAIFSFLFSACLTVLLVVFVEFLKSHNNLTSSSMPFLQYFFEKGGCFYVVFVLGLFFAIITTLLSCLIGVKRFFLNLIDSKVAGFKVKKQILMGENEFKHARTEKSKLNFKNFVTTLISVVLSFALSFVGFTTYVSVIYPIIGVINFVIFVFL